VGIVALLVVAEIVLVPLVSYLFQAPFFKRPIWLIAMLLAGTLGYCTVGTLFAAMLVRARSRDVLLPILLYPITIPVIIAGVRGVAALLEPELDVAIVRFWLSLIAAYDVVFITLALWSFEPLMTD
jgi:heme exporter protein B